MAKGSGKSSASAGTRKKHARRAAGPIAEPPPKEKKPKGKDKSKSKEPRQKIYIPPTKPAPIQPDPLDAMGLAPSLPPDLYISLKSLGKKDVVTKSKALEGLQAGWVDKCRAEGKDSHLISTLLIMLPVWFHHVSALFLHPSRRIRVSAAGLHASLLQIPAIRDQIYFFVRETASADQSESIVGTWCMLAHDVERPVATFANKAWNDAVFFPRGEAQSAGKIVLDETLLPALLSFVRKVLLDPSAIYSHLNPTPPVVAPPPLKRVAGKPVPAVSLKREDSESSVRSKSEEEEENEQDRKARLRVGALGALKWILDTSAATGRASMVDELTPLISAPALWTSLHHAQSSSFADEENFGFGQPGVRKSAWAVVQTLLRHWKGSIGPLLPLLSTAVLRSAWVEPDVGVRAVMWQPVLFFLKEFPNAWELEAAFKPLVTDGEDQGEDEDEDSSEDEDIEPSNLPAPSTSHSSAYQDFLQFLELGCSGSPLQGYPTVVIILSTIPSSTLPLSTSDPPLNAFFTSFWAALDGRALSSVDRVDASAAFLSALLECMVFLLRRLMRSGEQAGAREITVEQTGRAWAELAEGRLKVAEGVAGRVLAQTLVALEQMDKDLFIAAWIPLAANIKTQIRDKGASLVFAILKIFDDQFQDGSTSKAASHALIGDIVHSSLTLCEDVLRKEDTDISAVAGDVAPLVSLVTTFSTALFQDMEFANRIDVITTTYAHRLLSESTSLLLAYFAYRGDEERSLELWRVLLASVSSQPETAQLTILPLLAAANEGAIPAHLKSEGEELDKLAEKWLTEALGSSAGNMNSLALIRRILEAPGYFLSENSFFGLLHSLVSAFTFQVDNAARDPSIPLSSLDVPLDLIRTVFERRPLLLDSVQIALPLLPNVFLIANLFPRFGSPGGSSSIAAAQRLWTKWLENAPSEVSTDVLIVIKGKLRDLLCASDIRASPEDILHVVQTTSSLHVDLLDDIFPSRTELDNMLDHIPSDPIDPSLAVLDDLIPPASVFADAPVTEQLYDSQGFSSYARAVAALLQVFVEDRQMAKVSMWALRHFIALSIYADDFLKIPSASSPVFGRSPVPALNLIVSRTQQVATYLLTTSTDDGWHLRVVSAIAENKPAASLDDLARFIIEAVVHAKDNDDIRESRILRSILQHILGDSSTHEADQWMTLARKIEKTAPETSLAIISSITRFAPEPPRLDRYRNELAASLLGISSPQVNTEGLLVLRRLAATAPDPDSDTIFLPQLRAVNVMKACQQWIGSDEDVDEDVESMMTFIFIHLAPILQNVPGAHWELIFDVIENNLENCSFSVDSTLVTLARTLRLIVVVQDLVSTNKTLRGDWRERETGVLTLVRDLASAKSSPIGASTSRSICRELALSIIQDLPPSLMDHTTLSSMCHILGDSSTNVQIMAYNLLHESAKKRTEHFVIEAGVDTEAVVKADLPTELVEILQQNLNQDGLEQSEQDIFGYLLAWMIAFDLFTNASVKVRSTYIDQLRNLDIIATHFIPNIFDLLNLGEGIPKAFKLDVWAVDEYYISLYESGSSLSPQLLAAHLYYRALLTVPSLIRSWVLECKDRQLSTTVGTYTSQHFSPVIIRTELAHVKSPEAAAELADENLTIKVNSLHEIVASYLVDEQLLEIALKMPSDWPLHMIEVKDLKKVGVTENVWRAWILGVYKWSQNGHIVDALSLFKKNVAAHFEGQVECAICYSIISVVDYTLPRVACKTCKNRFHAACLYKWFNTSHTSSCPLCRSDIR